MIASEFAWTGRREMSSFQGLSRGMICIAATMASAAGVLNKVGAETKGAGPRMRPSWLMRWARATEVRARKIKRIRRIAIHQKAAAIKPQPQMTPQGGALSKPPSGFGGGSKPPF